MFTEIVLPLSFVSGFSYNVIEALLDRDKLGGVHNTCFRKMEIDYLTLLYLKACVNHVGLVSNYDCLQSKQILLNSSRT